jgi:hypothetical protein
VWRVACAGFRRLGFNLVISALAVPFIHGSFSYPTSHSWIPDPRLPIYLDRIHRTKHGSDSEVGSLIPSALAPSPAHRREIKQGVHAHTMPPAGCTNA